MSNYDAFFPTTPAGVPAGGTALSAAWTKIRSWCASAGMEYQIGEGMFLAAERGGKVLTLVADGSGTAPATLIATLRPFAAAIGEYAEKADDIVAQIVADPSNDITLV